MDAVISRDSRGMPGRSIASGSIPSAVIYVFSQQLFSAFCCTAFWNVTYRVGGLGASLLGQMF